MTLEFEVPAPRDVSRANKTLVYISGLHSPYSVSIDSINLTLNDDVERFTTEFPFELGFNNGLTIAVVVNGYARKFTSVADVAKAVEYGPALIEVD